ncbi:MAG TPA: magnesium/cobalt transporter CorA [Candidatus Tectomicrobia bacterium]|jgi:magnesium transporter
MDGVVNCVAYADGRRVAEVEIEDISEVLKQEDRFLWIGLYEPGEELLRQVQQEFGLHDLAIEDAHRAHQRPKIERYGNSLFVVLRTAQMQQAKGQFALGETHIFVGPRYIVSVRHGSSLAYTAVRSRCETTPDLLCQGPGFVLYALMDFIVDQYFPIVDALEDELEDLEERIFGEVFSRLTTTRIYHLKRRLLELKRAISPLVDICNRLIRFDLEFIPAASRPYFRDVYDHVIRINEIVDTMRELLTSALEAHLSLIAVSQNEVMKKLGGWVTILAVPTMVAGIYGMNFEFMPELKTPLGYPLVLAGMLGACGGLYWYFKRLGWL